LRPGDRVTITALFSEEELVETSDGYGGTVQEKVKTNKSVDVFTDIIVADMLNSSGDSILDIYEDYNSRTVYEQAQLDASDSFQTSVEPSSLIVALTPEEKELYYQYLQKTGIQFKMSIPQRVS
jgi:hypothetical protein